MYCPNCGKEIGEAMFCSACGTEFPHYSDGQQPSNGENIFFPADQYQGTEQNIPAQSDPAPSQKQKNTFSSAPQSAWQPFDPFSSANDPASPQFPPDDETRTIQLPHPVQFSIPPYTENAQQTPAPQPYDPFRQAPAPDQYGPSAPDPQQQQKKRRTITVTAIVLAALVLAGGTAALYFTGKLPFGAGKTSDTNVAATVLYIDGEAYDEALFAIAYENVFINTVSRSKTSDGTSFDPAVDAAAQQYDATRTYHDYFTDCAVETLEEFAYYEKEAEKNGITLLPENRETVDRTLADLRSSADNSNVSPDALAAALYGSCVTMEKYEAYLTADALVQQMRDSERERCRSEITEEEIQTLFKENRMSYLMADIRMIGIRKSDRALSLAEEFLSQVSDESTFVSTAKEFFSGDGSEQYDMETDTYVSGLTYSVTQSGFNSELADWLFSGDRRVNDKQFCENDTTVFAILVAKTAYVEERPQADIRAIFVGFDDADTDNPGETGTIVASDGSVLTNEGTGQSLAAVLKTYETAKGILDDYLRGEQTEEAFAALADANNPDTMPGGGLYENVAFGQMAVQFEEWIYAAGRQPGETGLVMTYSGWNVLYFIRRHEQAYWREDVTETLITQKMAASDEALENSKGTAERTDAFAGAADAARRHMLALNQQKTGTDS